MTISKISNKTKESLLFTPVFESKNPVFGSKSLEKLGNRVFRTFGNFRNFRNCSIPKFLKITKKWQKLELQKSWKTRSNSKTDSKVRLKVRNAGPYSMLTFISHLSTIYINTMFTVYLIKVVWEFGVGTLAFALALTKCCWVAKSKRNPFTKNSPLRNFRLFIF